MAKRQYTDSGHCPHPPRSMISADIPLPGSLALADAWSGRDVVVTRSLVHAVTKVTPSIILASSI